MRIFRRNKWKSVKAHGFISDPMLFVAAHEKINKIVPRTPIYIFQNELEIEEKIVDLITFSDNADYVKAVLFLMQLTQNSGCIQTRYPASGCQKIAYRGLLCEICYNNYDRGFIHRSEDDSFKAEYCGVCRHKVLAFEEERKVKCCGVCMVIRVIEAYNSLVRIQYNRDFRIAGHSRFFGVYLSVLRYFLNKAEGGHGLFTANQTDFRW
ncbi:MAG: hypothetical protein FWG68_10705 [Defluviitaleaceae bacterium]|nr:hypothetical protein [Defluviitaleaceae bacterium]